MTMQTVAAIPAHRRLLLLLRRELWEHRGSLVWAPLIVSGVLIVMLLVVVLFSKININGSVQLNDGSFNGMTLSMLLDPASYDSHTLLRLTAAMNQSLFVDMALVFVVLAFTVFFYCLGALYDDRRDRSLLFWASLPVSEMDTVLSKVLTATIVAPTVAVVVGIAVMVANWLLLALLIVLHGGQPLPLLWLASNPGWLALTQLAAIPVYALWALPAVGWLLMCSAFARSKPFLWAVMIPLLVGVFVTVLNQFGLIHVDLWGVWRDLVLRPFGHLFPVILSWLDLPADVHWESVLIQPGYLWRSLMHVQVWIGAGVGGLMIAAAIALRRWREAE